jgi:hypothetical protein
MQPVTPSVVSAVKAIPRGRLQETTLTRSAASSLLDRLVRQGLIEPRTYRVRTKTQSGTVVVFIEHQAEPSVEQVRQRRTVHAEAAPVPIPSPAEAAQFIDAQVSREHSLNSVARNFLGREVNAHTENTTYRRLARVIAQAQALIIQREGGRFEEEKAGRGGRTFRWTK